MTIPAPVEFDEIGYIMELNDEEGIIVAVYRARQRGMTWTAIGLILRESTDTVATKYGFVDLLVADGLPPMRPTETVAVEEQPPPPRPDYSYLKTMTNEELVDIAKKMSQRIAIASSRRNANDAGLREAAMIVLCERDMPASQIAKLIGLSHQRTASLINKYYNRIEKEWEAQRAQ